MRRSSTSDCCLCVVVVLSLLVVADAQWLGFSESDKQRQASRVAVRERVESLLEAVRRQRRYEDEQQRKHLRKKKLGVALQNNIEAEFGRRTFFLRLNKFADWYDDEYTAILGTKLPRRRLVPPMKRIGSRFGNTSHWLNVSTTATYLPPTLNWADAGWVTPVADQGDCASCWAFAACGALEAQIYNHTGKLYNLSRQNIVDCSPPLDADGCRGGVIQWAFDYVTFNDGINTEKVYPYVGKESQRCRFKNDNKLSGFIQSWVDLPIGNETAMLLALKLVGPLAAAVDARAVSFQMYSGGIYASSDCTTSINHGVLIVGYGTHNTSTGSLPYWIIMNSWGSSWGMNGYMYIARNVNMCGIALSATYPAI